MPYQPDILTVAQNPRYVPRPDPLPIPAAAWNDSPTYCLEVNDEWVSHILGVMEALDQPDAWQGTETEIDAAREQVNQIMLALMEACVTPVNPFIVGEVRLFAFSPAPDGWEECFGQALSRTTYADLFAAIGTKYGTGDGSTTFNVPYTKRRFIAGFEPVNGGDYDFGHTGGEESHVLTTTEMPAHTHPQRVQPNTGASTNRIQAQTASGATQDSALPTGSTGGGAAHENRPPWTVFAMFIYSGVA